MRDFVKWLGVSEKAAKVAVWLLIIMIFLITFNTALESMGLPFYAITYENLINIKISRLIQNLVTILVSILGFYSIVLLIFRIKEYKKILKYAVVYYIGTLITNLLFGYAVMQIYIVLYNIIFCYLYSGKKLKYIIYSIISMAFICVVQGIWYMAKARFIDYVELSNIVKSILSLDYFIIIGIIILVKEIYLKKRGEKDGLTMGKLSMDRRIQKRRKTSKEDSKKSSK